MAGQALSSRKRKGSGSPTDAGSFLAQQSHTTDRPQDRFEDAVDNSNSPFQHKLQHINAFLVSFCPQEFELLCGTHRHLNGASHRQARNQSVAAPHGTHDRPRALVIESSCQVVCDSNLELRLKAQWQHISKTEHLLC